MNTFGCISHVHPHSEAESTRTLEKVVLKGSGVRLSRRGLFKLLQETVSQLRADTAAQQVGVPAAKLPMPMNAEKCIRMSMRGI